MFSAFDSILGLFSKDIGIDLGTANTLLSVRGKGIVLCEPSVVAIQKGTNHVLAVGEDAKSMLGRTPDNILAIRPLKDGVIADFEITKSMLRYFIRKVHGMGFLVPRPKVLVAVPSGINEVEKRAVEDSVTYAGAREVHLVKSPMAAAIGIGLPIHEPTGNMIVDVGSGTTEVAVIAIAGIVESVSSRVGSGMIDDAIIQYMKRTYNLMIGERMSEDIKIKIGSAYPFEEEKTMEVKGRDIVAGLPKILTVNSEEIREAIAEPISSIVEAVRGTLERCPAELSADLVQKGIFLAGGGALLKGLDQLIKEETGLPVYVADDPLSAVALGTEKILEQINLLKKFDIYKRRRE
ncbi:MAG: rod shape-determining protein [Candidatus Aureabacteria bacterium]|nr:rod shape-determining protein [Candidatus Auribacterota bacterium]